jgi:hypothetical protein
VGSVTADKVNDEKGATMSNPIPNPPYPNEGVTYRPEGSPGNEGRRASRTSAGAWFGIGILVTLLAVVFIGLQINKDDTVSQYEMTCGEWLDYMRNYYYDKHGEWPTTSEVHAWRDLSHQCQGTEH